MTRSAGDIVVAFRQACRDELEAPKPGNVHRFADGHRMTAADFVLSADAAAPAIARSGARVGARILDAVEATRAAVGANTNLGIVLLCAPLAAAVEADAPDLRAALVGVLDGLDVTDARLAFEAIRLAAPGGLGRSERHDVHEPATVTLQQAMAEAGGRDRIARQYVSGFEDVFMRGVPALQAGLRRWGEPRWATLAVYLEFLSAFPDSHVARKHGGPIAEQLRRDATVFRDRIQSADHPDAVLPDLLSWDASLKARFLNPGTSADLTVAVLFVHHLGNVLPSARKNG